jgi:hypothetical protein
LIGVDKKQRGRRRVLAACTERKQGRGGKERSGGDGGGPFYSCVAREAAEGWLGGEREPRGGREECGGPTQL